MGVFSVQIFASIAAKRLGASSNFADLREPEPILITKRPEYKEPWIDPKEDIPNYKKHEKTCASNRKKRKKKRRR